MPTSVNCKPQCSPLTKHIIQGIGLLPSESPCLRFGVWLSKEPDLPLALHVRWTAHLAEILAESRVGIICATADTIGSRWLAFEAGALAKRFPIPMSARTYLIWNKALFHIARFPSSRARLQTGRTP